MSKLDIEFNTKKEHTFWVIASRNYPEKIVTNNNGIQIYLDPDEAKLECDLKNAEIREGNDIKNDPYRVLRCECLTSEETNFEN